MPRARDPNRDKAHEMWKDSDGKLDLAEIARRLGVSPGTVRGWKSKDGWLGNGALQKERNAPNNKERSKPESDPPIGDNGLSEKKQIFVLEYMRDFNATRAAIAAGYSKRSAYTEGWRLLKNADVQAEISRIKSEREAELGLDITRIISEYMKIAFADITDLLDFGQKEETIYGEDGKPMIDPETGDPVTYKRNYVSFRDSDMIDGTVVGEVKQGKDGVSIKLHDKMRALKELEKYLGYMDEETKLRVKKMQVEVDRLEGGGKSADAESWVEALQQAAAKRRTKAAGHE